MIDIVRKIFRNSLIYSVGNISSKVVGFLFLPAYLNLLTTSELGIYSLMQISFQILVAIFGIGLNTSLNRFYLDKKYEDRQKPMIFTVVLTLVITTILLWLLANVFSQEIAFNLFDNANRTYLVQLLAVYCGLEILITIPLTILKLNEKPINYSVLFLTKFVSVVIATVYLVVILERNVEGIFEAQILGNITGIILASKIIYQHSRMKIDFALLKELIVYGYPLIFSALSGVLLNVLDRYVLKAIKGLSETGIYGFGFQVANTIKVFIVTSIQMAITPLIYKMMYEDNAKRFYSKIMTYSAFVIMVFVLFVSVFGFEVIGLFVHNFAQDPELIRAYTILPFIAFSNLIGMMIFISVIGLNITKKTKIVGSVIAGSSILNFILNVWLIPIFDLYGAAGSTVITQLIYWIIVYNYAQKNYKINYEIKKVISVFIIGITIILISLSLNNLNLLVRLPIKIALIASYPFFLYFLKFYEEEELVRIFQSFRKWKYPSSWKQNIKELLK